MALGSATRFWSFAWAAAIVAAVLIVSWQAAAHARQEAGKAAADEMISGQAFRDWLDVLRAEARAKGISDATLEAALGDIAPLVAVIERDRRQPEFTQTFWAYLDQRVSDERVKRGRALLAKHRDLLNEIYARYGVPPRYLIAFWGLETNFGDYLGNFRVIDALATLAYDRRRARFFRGELLGALQILEEGHITPDAMMGSWAGAMGQMQFIPSTFIGYAVDHTGDGRKDIWGSLPDAFSSAANFLYKLGWRAAEPWGWEVLLPRDFDLMLAAMQNKKTLTAWSGLGVRRTDGKALPHLDREGAILLPQGHKGPAFLVYDNFRIIMRWNNSINYALSVGHLADRISGLPPLAAGRDAEHKPLSRAAIGEIQQLLNRLGFEAGAADGLPGPRTRTAIRAFQQKHALPPDGYPEPALLQKLRAAAQALP
ncbi:MAG: lytic murein transglycosylase [Desulfobacteraceae bacterium]|jgi:membrane-bound lytic murein transglycosylase B